MREVKKVVITFDHINLIGPRSTLTVSLTSCRFSIFVKGLWCCSTGCTPTTILHCKKDVPLSHCCQSALCNGVISRAIGSIQNSICSFQGLNCSLGRVFVAANSFVSCERYQGKDCTFCIFYQQDLTWLALLSRHKDFRAIHLC